MSNWQKSRFTKMDQARNCHCNISNARSPKVLIACSANIWVLISLDVLHSWETRASACVPCQRHFAAFEKENETFFNLSLLALTRNKVELNLLDIFQRQNIILKSSSQCSDIDWPAYPQSRYWCVRKITVNCGGKNFPSSPVPSRAPPF